MPIPFIAGLVVGAGAIVAYNNRSKIKNTILESAQKTKDFASELKDKVCEKSQKKCCSDKKDENLGEKCETTSEKAENEEPKTSVKKPARKKTAKENLNEEKDEKGKSDV